MKKLFCAVLVLSGCSIITDGDRQLTKEILHGGSGCIFIQGSGGGGAGMIGPMVPGGGYGQGSLAAARGKEGQKIKCTAQGAELE